MNFIKSPRFDNLAIGLSFLCVLHCLATPLLIVLIPSLTALGLDSESFHTWLLMAVIPISVLSLIVGCKRHKYYRVFAIGLLGLVFLVSATQVEDLQNGEILEKAFTVIGAIIVAIGHYMNFRLCRASEQCGCAK